MKRLFCVILTLCLLLGMFPASAYAASSDDSVIDESILRAKILTNSYSFRFYREWDSPVQIMSKQLDPMAASAWYLTDNLIDVYYKAIKQGNALPSNVARVTDVEFYEYLLLKMLDNKELDYVSLTEPFALIDDVSDGNIDTALLKKLISKGFKAGTKITDKNMREIKSACEAVCGTDDVLDIGWMDAILVPGKTIDKFASEFVSLYELTTVSDARANAIKLIGESSSNEYLREAANNVCASIRRAKSEGIDYCVSEGLEEGIDSVITWLLDKVVDNMCDLHPASAIWKKTADTTMFLMNTVFLTDDISTDTIYILALANIENTMRKAINSAETRFNNSKSAENAWQLIALADCYQREMLVGCDMIESMVNHCERSDLNWHGILDLLRMAAEKKLDFGATLKWMFGDSNSSYAQLRNSVKSIKKIVEEADYYGGVDVLELIREVKSVTPSAWAKREVDKAIAYGILPDWTRNNYQSNITRIEFCALLEYMIEEKAGRTIDQIVEECGILIKPPFDDALYTYVNDVARLGIINGVGGNQFNPLGEITRQEAATMLYRTAAVLGYDTSAKASGEAGIASWAVQGVDFVIAQGIMNGTGKGFEPTGKYTKEQAIITMVRFFDNVHEVSAQREDRIVGSYKGSYFAAQGETGLTLTVYKEAGKLMALFEFYNLPSHTNAKSGSYTMEVISSNGRYQFVAKNWVDKPSGYELLNLTGNLNGDVLSGETPTKFSVSRFVDTRNSDDIIGAYKGTYFAGQGETGLTVTVNKFLNDYEAIFEFYNLPGRNNAKSGSFTMKVVPTGNGYRFHPKEWINRPSGYSMLNFEGALVGDTLSGEYPTRFSVTRFDNTQATNVDVTVPTNPFTQQYWVIFTEGYRNNRLEASTIDSTLSADQLYIVWNTSLTINNTSGSGRCNQYYLNQNNEWIQIGNYHRLTDKATHVIASNLDIYDQNGNLVLKKCAYSDVDWTQVNQYR